MKKLFAGILTLSLVLAACGNDESKKEDDNKDSNQTTQESKTNQDKAKHKDNDSNKEKQSNASSSDQQNNDQAQNSNDNQNATSEQSNDHQQASQTTEDTNGQSDNANQQATQQTSNQTNDNNQGTNQTGYVAPYQGQDAVPAARTIAKAPVDQSTLKVLPNFPQSLQTAQNEIDGLNGQTNPYNDFGVQDNGDGSYAYLFSFANQSQPGTYALVKVDQQGKAQILDPTYQAGQ
ncbi:hypothetical protein ACY2DA_03475 [Staphylococcus simulans]